MANFATVATNLSSAFTANIDGGSYSLTNLNGLTLVLASVGTTDPGVAGQLFRTGTDLKISLG